MVDEEERRFEADEQDDHPEPCAPGSDVTPELFLRWRSPRDGAANPEVQTNPVWQWLVRARISAYQANARFAGPSAFDAGPGWCCMRFGQSCTRLPDGRLVRIAGEHEDHYDPDFHIYNDVIVRSPDGSVAIFGYPSAVFPPTDFHSATLVGDRIVVIGCLGHPEQRQPGSTPVFAFDTRTWACSAVPTCGSPPGWIHRHTARLEPDGRHLVVAGGMLDCAVGEPFVENVDDWRLDLTDGRWTKLTARPWQQWRFSRSDRRWHHLFDLRTACWLRRVGDRSDFAARVTARLTEELGVAPDLDLAEQLYRPSVPCEAVQGGDEDEHEVVRVRVAGVTLRFVEDSSSVRLVAEGLLDGGLMAAVVEEFRDKLARLERCEWVARRI